MDWSENIQEMLLAKTLQKNGNDITSHKIPWKLKTSESTSTQKHPNVHQNDCLLDLGVPLDPRLSNEGQICWNM